MKYRVARKQDGGWTKNRRFHALRPPHTVFTTPDASDVYADRNVRALCGTNPRAGGLWIVRDGIPVTCPKCLQVITRIEAAQAGKGGKTP